MDFHLILHTAYGDIVQTSSFTVISKGDLEPIVDMTLPIVQTFCGKVPTELPSRLRREQN